MVEIIKGVETRELKTGSFLFLSFSFSFTKNLHQHTVLSLLTYLTTLSHIACVYYRLLTTHTTHTLTNNYHKTEVVSEKKERKKGKEVDVCLYVELDCMSLYTVY